MSLNPHGHGDRSREQRKNSIIRVRCSRYIGKLIYDLRVNMVVEFLLSLPGEIY